MKKRFLAISLAAALIAMLFTGCGGQGTEPASAKPAETAAAESPAVQQTGHMASNEVAIGIAQDFDSLDPDYMTAAGTKEILFNVFEGLVKPASNGEIVPAVASEITKADDGLSYTFTLRQGVRFHNGDPVEMKDVVYSIERRWKDADPAAQLAALSVIESLEHDDSTLTIRLSEPSNEFLAAVMNCYILPAGYDSQETAPVGTGPFRFVSRAVQDHMILERFEDYWGRAGARPAKRRAGSCRASEQ